MSAPAVAEFRLSERAERDHIEIHDYPEGTFGAYQAEAYHAGLERTLDLIANFPRIGRAVDDIAPDMNRPSLLGERHIPPGLPIPSDGPNMGDLSQIPLSNASIARTIWSRSGASVPIERPI